MTQKTPCRVTQASDFTKYPVISGAALLAIGVTIAWWTGTSVSPLLDSAETRPGQLWRFATSIFSRSMQKPLAKGRTELPPANHNDPRTPPAVDHFGVILSRGTGPLCQTDRRFPGRCARRRTPRAGTHDPPPVSTFPPPPISAPLRIPTLYPYKSQESTVAG